MKVWVLTWRYSDNSDSGILTKAYKSQDTANHILEIIRDAEPARSYGVIEIDIVEGDLT